MENNNINRTVIAQQAIIKAAQETLELVRRLCKHGSYNVGWWSFGIGKTSTARICKYCLDNIGEPSFEEEKRFKESLSE